VSAPVVTAAIGLGANLGQPDEQVRQAIERIAALPKTRLLARSPLYQSAPMGPPQPDYCNAVVVVETQMEARALLEALQHLEAEAGRNRAGDRWCARELDCDLLLYGAVQQDGPGLTLPHPGIAQRNFVLIPLADIGPDIEIPGVGRAGELAARCSHEGLAPWPDLP